MAERTFGAGVARALFQVSVERGADPAILAARAGINIADLEDQDARLPLSRYVALMRAGKELCGDTALALHFGEAAELSELSVVGLIGAASTSVIDGLSQLNRYSRLVVDVGTAPGGRFQIETANDGVWLIDTRIDPNSFFELTESTFARMISSSRRRGVSAVRRVHVTHGDPGYRAEYERVFGVPVFFESDRNALFFDASWLDQRFPQQPRYVFGVLSERADALLKKLENSKSVRGQVESRLMPSLHTGEARIDSIAAQMGVSRWTLTRRLKEEGTTFAQVLDDLRREMALHYLSGKKVSVNEAAYLVGFSEAAAFSRAFKRWTGMSPKSARGQARGRGR